MKCPNCGAEQKDKTVFCGACGAKLAGAAPPEDTASGTAAPQPAPDTPPVPPQGDAEVAPPVGGPGMAPGGPAPQPVGGPGVAPGGYAPQPVGGPGVAPGGPAPQPVGGPGMAPGGPAPQPVGGPGMAPGGYAPQPVGGPGVAPGGYAPQPMGGPGMAPGYQPYAMAGAPQAAVKPPKKKGKKKAVVAIIIVVAILLVLVAGVLIFLLDLRNPTQKVRDAWNNTRDAIRAERQATADELGFGLVGGWFREGAVSVDYELGISTAELAMLGGSASLRGEINTDFPAERMDMSVGLGVGGSVLTEARLAFDGGIVAVSLPDLVDGYYGLDLSRPELIGNSELRNYPQIVNVLSIPGGLYQALASAATGMDTGIPDTAQAQLDAAEDTLWNAMTVAKGAKVNTQVNGASLECESFTVTVKKDALLDYLDEAFDILMESYLEGLGDSVDVNGMTRQLDALIDQLDDALYGDPVLTAYVKPEGMMGKAGRLVKVEAVLEGERGYFDEATILVEIGNEYNLSDALTIEVETDGSGLRFALSGNQVIAEGIYSRTIEIEQLGSRQAPIMVELWYDTAADQDNFVFNLYQEGGQAVPTLSVAGTLVLDQAQNTLYADLYDIYYSNGRDTSVELSLELTIDPGAAVSPEPVNPTMLTGLDSNALDGLMEQLRNGLMQLLLGLAA